MTEQARTMTESEMWDVLDREGIIEFIGEGWVFSQSKFMEKVDECDCLPCQSIRALEALGQRVQIQVLKGRKIRR